MTDARVTFACSRFDTGGGWRGDPVSMAVFNSVSKVRAALRSQGKMLVGQIRFPWLARVGSTPKSGWGSQERLAFDVEDDLGGTWRLTLALAGGQDAAELSADIVRRAARTGSPARTWTMRSFGPFNASRRRDRLPTASPGPSTRLCSTSSRPAGVSARSRPGSKGAKNFKCFTWKADRDALSDLEVSQLSASPYGPYGQVAFAADGRRMRFGLSQHGQAVLTTIRMLAGSELPSSGSSGELRTDGIYASGIDDLDMGTLFYHFDGSGFALGGRYDGTVRDWVDEATSGAGERIPYRRVGPRYESVEEPQHRKTFEVLPDGRLVLRYHVNEQSSPEFGGFASELWFVPFDRLGQYWGTPPAAVPESPQWWPVLLPNGEMEAPDLGHVRARVKG